MQRKRSVDCIESIKQPQQPPASSTVAGFAPCTYKLLDGAENFFRDLCHELRHAVSRVDMQFYSFECDSVGLPIANELIELRESGLAVRLMVDDYINHAHNDKYIRIPRRDRTLQRSIVKERAATDRLLQLMRERGVDVKITNPLRWTYSNVLQRDHKKIVVIDSDVPSKAVAYIGAINPTEHNSVWNDYMVKMTGDMIPKLQEDFDLTWSEKNHGGVYQYSDGIILSEVPGYSVVIPIAKGLILQSKTKVVLESAYLWGGEMIDALKTAAKTVDVSVITPMRNHKRLYTLSDRALEILESMNIKVYRFSASEGMTHARALLVDDSALVGSNAFNGFLSGRMGELNLVTRNASLVKQLEEFFTKDIAQSIRNQA